MKPLVICAALFALFTASLFVQDHVMWRQYTNDFAVTYTRCQSVVVSLATFGVRTFNIEPTLLSLMSQTAVPDVIVVHVALKSRTENISGQQLRVFLDSRFRACRQSVKVENGIECDNGLLVVIGEDFGPATKVLGSLSLPMIDDNTCIISVDDDTVYDPYLVETLTALSPDDGALGFSCEEVPHGFHFVRLFFPDVVWWKTLSGEFGWLYPFSGIMECKGWLQGYQGIVYRRKFFEPDVFDIASMPNGCFYADDVRLAGYLWTKGIKRYVFPHFTRGGFLGIGRYTPVYHMKKNASNALSLVSGTMQANQWPCVHFFNEFK